jgi:hypothetical protein
LIQCWKVVLNSYKMMNFFFKKKLFHGSSHFLLLEKIHQKMI